MRSYPDNWDRMRHEVYERDDHTCQNCGARGGPGGSAELHAHHIVPLSDGGSNKRRNLTTLCSGCHAAIHTSSTAPTAPEGETTSSEVVTSQAGPVGKLAGFVAILSLLFVLIVTLYSYPIITLLTLLGAVVVLIAVFS